MSYKCNKCNVSFKRKDYLDKHLNRKIPCDRSSMCKICKKGFYNYSNLKKHLQRCHNKDNQDDIKSESSSSDELSSDSDSTDESIDEKTVCRYCRKILSSKYSLNRHERICPSKNVNKKELIPIEKYKEKIDKLRRQLNELENTKIKQINNSNNSNNSNSNNVNSNNVSNIDNSITNNITLNLTPFIRPNIDYLTRAELKKCLFKNNEVDMMTGFVHKVFANLKHPENHSLYIDSRNNLHRFNGKKWTKEKITDASLTKTLQIILYAIERKLRIGDDDATTKEYKKLIGVREYSNIERMAFDHRDEFTKVLRGMETIGRESKARWKAENNISDSENSELEEPKTNPCVEDVD